MRIETKGHRVSVWRSQIGAPGWRAMSLDGTFYFGSDLETLIRVLLKHGELPPMPLTQEELASLQRPLP